MFEHQKHFEQFSAYKLNRNPFLAIALFFSFKSTQIAMIFGRFYLFIWYHFRSKIEFDGGMCDTLNGIVLCVVWALPTPQHSKRPIDRFNAQITVHSHSPNLFLIFNFNYIIFFTHSFRLVYSVCVCVYFSVCFRLLLFFFSLFSEHLSVTLLEFDISYWVNGYRCAQCRFCKMIVIDTNTRNLNKCIETLLHIFRWQILFCRFNWLLCRCCCCCWFIWVFFFVPIQPFRFFDFTSHCILYR